MLHLSNGHKFSVACASGALGFLNGWWWERPLAWLGALRPEEWTITVKTLTLAPRKGNLRIWWPFNGYRNCVQDFTDSTGCKGTVNAVGLTNPGLRYWIDKVYPKAYKHKLNLIVSVMPTDPDEAEEMGRLLAPLNIKGVEINYSCPNIEHADSYGPEIADLYVQAFRETCNHPIGIKLGYFDPFSDILKMSEDRLEWTTLINTIPWSKLYPDKPSPLAPWGLEGGVSGEPIVQFARDALFTCRTHGIQVPRVTSGGVDSLYEASFRMSIGEAKAVQIGSLMKNHPIKAQKLHDNIKEWL